MSILQNVVLNCTLLLHIGPNEICLRFAEFHVSFTALLFVPLHYTKTEQSFREVVGTVICLESQATPHNSDA